MIIALVPAHDEAPRIEAVVRATAAHLPVIVVDDGSVDDTAGVATRAGATVLRQAPNQGKGAALRTGLAAAIERGAGAVLTLDADGQHDPEDIPAFLGAWAGGRLDLLIGRRDFGAMPPIRRLANHLGGLAFSWAVGRSIPDNQSGYRLLSRRLAQVMLTSREPGFEFEVEMIATAIGRGWAIGWVPIRTIYAGQPSHIRPARHLASFVRTVRSARRIVREGDRMRP